METYAYISIAVFALMEVFVQANIFKPREQRQSPLQRSVPLCVSDMLAKLIGLAGVVMLLLTIGFWISAASLAVMLWYAIRLRRFFFRREVNRLKAITPKVSEKHLCERVKRRDSLHYAL
jgi:ABC-type transport system involved in cytochrome c biogenesis permease subunit